MVLPKLMPGYCLNVWLLSEVVINAKNIRTILTLELLSQR